VRVHLGSFHLSTVWKEEKLGLLRDLWGAHSARYASTAWRVSCGTSFVFPLSVLAEKSTWRY
jgi:hypothetical protein